MNACSKAIAARMFTCPRSSPPERLCSHTQNAGFGPIIQTAQQPRPQTLTGKVVETMNSGGYTYVNLEKDGKSDVGSHAPAESRGRTRAQGLVRHGNGLLHQQNPETNL